MCNAISGHYPPHVVTERRASAGAITMRLVGFLFLVEITSGVLQGFYVPLISDLVIHLGIRDADFNWFEAAQLLVSALVVPVLAKLGDMYGHKRILLISTALTAAASWWLAFAATFPTFLLAWALQGFYVVWLPLEVALIFDRGRRSGTAAARTRRAAALLVVALELGAIIGALGGPAAFGAFGGDVTATLALPAIAVTLVFLAILLGVPESEPVPGRTLDAPGFLLLTAALLLITSGLTFLRIDGPGTWWVWALVVAGIALVGVFGRFELGRPDPAVDIRVLRSPAMWPVQLTAGLIGISVLGAQAPLSTYAGTDPALGYGLGLDASTRSYLIGLYVVMMVPGALLFPVLSRRLTPRVTLIIATFLVTLGYGLFLPLHLVAWQVFLNMAIAAVGTGALVAALPAAAAAAAPRGQTGIAAGLTNTTKTIGGSFASAVFGVVLLSGTPAALGRAASLTGYMIVWTICAAAGLAAAVALFAVPKLAFGDPAPEAARAAGGDQGRE